MPERKTQSLYMPQAGYKTPETAIQGKRGRNRIYPQNKESLSERTYFHILWWTGELKLYQSMVWGMAKADRKI